MKTYHLPLVLLVALTLSCQKKECHNTNPVFESNAPASAIYKTELVRLIAASQPTDIHYYLKGFTDTETTDYLLLNISGKDFCATSTVALSGNDAVANQLRGTRGMGYNGAELEGLHLNAGRDGTLFYESCDNLVD